MSILTEKPTVEFCEKAGSGLIARPFYALSNLGYPVVSFFILKDSKDTLAKYFALTAGTIGTFSFIYDSYPRRITQLFDLGGMYLFVSFLISINLIRILKKDIKLAPIYCLPMIMVGLILTYFLKGSSGNIIFGSFIVLYIVLELWSRKFQKAELFNLWLRALTFFVVGFMIWALDFFSIYCMPGNFLNGRGAFHLVTAYSIYLLYSYYASNKNNFGLK